MTSSKAKANSPPMPPARRQRGLAGPKYASISQMMNDLEAEPVPILCANGLAPSGTVDLNTYLQLRDEIIDGIQQAGQLDGICLVLHGALLVEHIWSGETDLVRSIRAVVGNDVLISARFDLHGNLTEEFANKTDIWTVYRTAPHRDAPQTLERAMTLLAHCIRGGHRPHPVFVRVPMILPGERATTDVEPMKSLLELAIEIGQQPGILTAEILVGFGWADAPYSSSSVVVIAEDEPHLPHARRQAKRLAKAMWDQRHNFTFDQEVACLRRRSHRPRSGCRGKLRIHRRFRGQPHRGHTRRCSLLSVASPRQRRTRRHSGRDSRQRGRSHLFRSRCRSHRFAQPRR